MTQTLSISDNRRLTAQDVIQALHDVMAYDEDSAITAPELAELVGVDYYSGTDKAGVNGGGNYLRVAIRDAVKLGYPVCSNNVGYWFAETVSAAEPAIAYLEARGFAFFERARKLRQSVLNQS